MKLLIVAHPDDEIIWFEPSLLDKILIVFGKRDGLVDGRRRVLQNHPHAEIIEYLEMQDNSKKISKTAEEIVKNKLNEIKSHSTISAIFTHNTSGEYGHIAHKFLNKIVIEVFRDTEIWVPAIYNKDNTSKILMIRRNLESYEQIKKIYLDNNCWTFKHNYIASQYETYQRVL